MGICRRPRLVDDESTLCVSSFFMVFYFGFFFLLFVLYYFVNVRNILLLNCVGQYIDIRRHHYPEIRMRRHLLARKILSVNNKQLSLKERALTINKIRLYRSSLVKFRFDAYHLASDGELAIVFKRIGMVQMLAARWRSHLCPIDGDGD